jgi:hypothetical protein
MKLSETKAFKLLESGSYEEINKARKKLPKPPKSLVDQQINIMPVLEHFDSENYQQSVHDQIPMICSQQLEFLV